MANDPAGTVDLDALLDDALEGFEHAGTSAAGKAPVASAAPSATAAATPASTLAAAAAATDLEEAWGEVAAASSGAGTTGGDVPPTPAAAQAASSSGAPSGAAASSSGGGGGGGKARGLAFDPLARRQPARAAVGGGPAGLGGARLPGMSSSAQPDSIDELSLGLSKLLEELAKADEGLLDEEEDEEEEEDGGEATTAAAAAGAGGSSGASSTWQRQQQQQQDLQATLRALSEQAPSFAGSSGAGGGMPGDAEDEMLRLLAEQLGALGGGAAGTAGEAGAGGPGGLAGGAPPEMASLMESLMQQLLSKDVLYQPMKDIGAKYPSWLEANKDKLSPEEQERYRRQHGYIQRICSLYETSPSDFPQLVDLLQQMQQCGQPPQEIVDELAPGMQFGPDGLPTFGGGDEALPPELKDCTIQ